MEFKKTFFLEMQAKNRQKELDLMRNLKEDHDTITKKVFKDRKTKKMELDDENIYSSSSDEDDLSKTLAPTLKHVFNHKFFDDLKGIPMVKIKEQKNESDTLMTTERKHENNNDE